jgi:acyl carrier protein
MKQLLSLLNEIRPEKDFSQSTNFLADGMLDSFDVVALVSALDKTFNISIEGVDVVPENFQNLAAIETLLQKYGVKP